jgi:hypothetical protein
MTWYPASWAPGVNGAGDYTPRGLSAELCGGPLDGRRGHVYNALECLWVARYGSEDFVVASFPSRPDDLPSGALLVGCYVYRPSDRALHWDRLEAPVAGDGNLIIPKHSGGIARHLSGRHFGGSWRVRLSKASLWSKLLGFLRRKQ